LASSDGQWVEPNGRFAYGAKRAAHEARQNKHGRAAAVQAGPWTEYVGQVLQFGVERFAEGRAPLIGGSARGSTQVSLESGL
jgi:hypothetical protein